MFRNNDKIEVLLLFRDGNLLISLGRNIYTWNNHICTTAFYMKWMKLKCTNYAKYIFRLPFIRFSLQQNNLGKPVVTGNWGCGSLKGDHQLKGKDLNLYGLCIHL